MWSLITLTFSSVLIIKFDCQTFVFFCSVCGCVCVYDGMTSFMCKMHQLAQLYSVNDLEAFFCVCTLL